MLRRRPIKRRVAAFSALALLAGVPAALPPAAAVDQAPAAATTSEGYWLVAADGGVFSFGQAPFYGSTGSLSLNRPITGLAPTSSGRGYWMVASDGGVFAFGDAPFHGSTGNLTLNKPIVGMAPTPTGRGYWMVASDGGVFSFGDAPFLGSTGGLTLARPIVGMAPTPTGRGYWMVASDGGVFSFGDAGFFGAAPQRGRFEVVGMTPTPTGQGYWQATATGAVQAFGDAAPLSGAGLSAPAAGLAPSGGSGFWLVGRDGSVASFGDAQFYGSTAGVKLNKPVVGMARRPSAVPTKGFEDPEPVTPSERGETTTTTTVPAGGRTEAASWYPSAPPKATGQGQAPSSGAPDVALLPESDPGCGLPSPANSTPDPEASGEASGLTASTRYPGVHWMIRDSGPDYKDQVRAAVYAVRVDPDSGITTMQPFAIDPNGRSNTGDPANPGLVNDDWEDVSYTVDPWGFGHLWVVSSGQGGNATHIYEVAEPNPDAPAGTKAELLNLYRYERAAGEDQTEASFIHDGYLVLATKTANKSRLWRFDSLKPDQVNRPAFVGELGYSRSISVIRQSPDRKTLITASHEVVNLYRSNDGSGSIDSFTGRLPDCQAKSFAGGHVEGGEWVGNDRMVFLDEIKNIWRLRVTP